MHLARIAPLLLIAACSRAPDMATCPLIGRWDVEGPFSPEQRAAAIARGENPEQWDAWATAVTKSGKLEAPTQYFDFQPDGRASFPVVPPGPIMTTGADSLVGMMKQADGEWELLESTGEKIEFRTMVGGRLLGTYAAHFETPQRLIVRGLTPRAWVRRASK